MPQPVEIDDLLLSYRAYLLAKIQEGEFASWGGVITDTFRKRIAEHQEMENTYLAEERTRRKG